MISALPVPTALLVAAALAVSRPAPAERCLTAAVHEPSHPRDGPAGVPGHDTDRCASDIGLFAACAHAGLTPAAAAAAVAETYAGQASPWHTTAALLALGAEPERAWSELHVLPGGADLANLVLLSNSSGSAIAQGCARVTERLRDEAAHDATAKAERAGVLIAIPLSAFFLPAFFALGLAPVVISLGAEMMP